MNKITTSDSELLYNFFSFFGPLSDELFAEIIKCFEKKTFKKGESILKIGEIETKAKLVIKGVVHQYVYEDNVPVTINLTPKGFSFNSLKSYLEGSPSLETQEAITDVELLQIDKEDMEGLAKSNHEFGFLLVKTYEYVLLDRENRSFLIQYRNPSKRFKLFHETVVRCNLLLKDTPDKFIASYLNMTPQQYSKEKSNLESMEE